MPNPRLIPKGTYEEVGFSLVAAGTTVCILVPPVTCLFLAPNMKCSRDLTHVNACKFVERALDAR